MKNFFIVIISLFLFGCDSLDSSFDYSKVSQKPEIVTKPQACIVDFSKTCWSDSIQRLTSCLKDHSSGVFSVHQKFCTNGTGSLVSFADPVAMFARPYDVFQTPIQFSVFPDSVKECLRVEGTRNDFVVTNVLSGQRVKWMADEEAIHFSCLDGQNVRILYKDFAGCEKAQGPSFVNTIPGLQLETFKSSGVESGGAFSFRGAPDVGPVFQCEF